MEGREVCYKTKIANMSQVTMFYMGPVRGRNRQYRMDALSVPSKRAELNSFFLYLLGHMKGGSPS